MWTRLLSLGCPVSFATFTEQTRLVHLDALVAQLVLGLRDLAEQALVRLGRVVEAEEAESERRERVRAERDEEPPGKLQDRM